ncbi:MAG: hypothetical protein O7C75_09435 [Verrucomicrobia bacterium]|nr:hypothetical protein [Verrucomicrobiota bacterium]
MNSYENPEEQLFQKCLELPPGEREQYVKDSCPDDPELRDSVLSLLRSHETAGGFLESLPEEDSAKVAERLQRIAPSEESPGDQIGRYHLLELIGEGAWGSVWMAQQTADNEAKWAGLA